jgi:hypothetical protein
MKGTYLVMRYAPRIGYPATAPRIVSVAGRAYTLNGALAAVTIGRPDQGLRYYWIAKAGQPAHVTRRA